MNEFIGSSGTLAGAVLETVGYYYQSWLLDALGQPFFHSVGSFIYIAAAIAAMYELILSGKYKFGVWFFMGPTLFIASVFPRTATTGADWQFGSEPRRTDETQQKIETILTPAAQGNNLGNANVSSVFAWYNQLVSTSVREVVAVLNSHRQEADLKFLMRSQMYGNLISPALDNEGLRALLHRALLGQCRELMEAGNEAVDVTNSDKKRELLLEKYTELAAQRNIRLKPVAAAYVAALQTDYGALHEPGNAQFQVTTTATEEEDNISYYYQHYEDLIYNHPRPALVDATAVYIPLIEAQNQQIGNQLQAAYGPDGTINPDSTNVANHGWLAAQRQTQENLTAETQNKVFSCHEIWNMVYAGLHRWARDNYLKTLESAAHKGMDVEALHDEFKDIMQVDQDNNIADTQLIYRAIAKRVFTNEFKKGSLGALISRYEDKGEVVTNIGFAPESELTAAERTNTGNREWAERTQMMVAAASLPYYQGLAMYFLAIAYPFFALLLLVPGKHSGFFTWFALWFWVKCWDVGFAIVMLLDDVLFTLFVAQNADLDGPGANELDQNLAFAIHAMRESDPTFQLSTYYNIIGVALIGIPVIMSQVILGTVTGGAGLIASGLNRYTGSSFGTYGDGGGLGAAAYMAQSQPQVAGRMAQAKRAQVAKAEGYSRNDKGHRIGVKENTQDYMQNWSKRNTHGGGKGGKHLPTPGIPAYYSLNNAGLDRSNNFWGMSRDEMAAFRRTNARWHGLTKGLTKRTKVSNIVANGAQVHDVRRAALGGGAGAGAQFGRMNRRMFYRDVAAAPIAAVSKVLGSAERAANTFQTDRVGLEAGWASYDGMNTWQVQEYSNFARLYNGFEIPWVEYGAWQDEFNYQVDILGEQIMFIADAVAAAGEMGGSIIDASASRRTRAINYRNNP